MKYKIITIEREYASGGTEIGKRLSETLGFPCYGKEILEIAAKRQHTTPDYLAHLEETATNSFLYSLVMMSRVISTDGSGPLSHEERLNLAESEIIREIANEKSCIIIGRGGAFALQSRNDVLRVFIHADMDFRRTRAIKEYGDDPAHVDGIIRQFDRRRSNYYSANTGKRWSDSREYHMVLDSSRLGLDGCAKAIISQFQ